MKHSAIAGLFIAGALLTSPVFAADKDLCAGNLQAIKDFVTSQPSLPETSMNNIKADQEKALALKRRQRQGLRGDHLGLMTKCRSVPTRN